MTDPSPLPLAERVLLYLRACSRDLPLAFGATVGERQVEAFRRIAGISSEEARRAFREALSSGTILIDRSTDP